MDYNLLKKIIKRNGLTIKQVATAVGFSDAGFHRSIKEDSFRVQTLEKCATVLNVTMCDFFDCEPNVLKEDQEVYINEWKNKYFKTLERCNEMLEENMELRRQLNYTDVKKVK